MNKKYLVSAIVFLVLLIGVFAATRLSQKNQDIREEAATQNASLSFTSPSTTVVRGQKASTTIQVNPGTNNQIVGVDIVVTFDRNVLQLTNIIPNTTTNLKTFVPLSTSNTFNASQVIATANSTGTITFGALAFDNSSGTNLGGQTTSFMLATLEFSTVTTGVTSLSFIHTTNSTTDSNIVSLDTPTDTLQTTTPITFTIVNQPTNTPTMTPTRTPTRTPTSVPPTITLTPTRTPTLMPGQPTPTRTLTPIPPTATRTPTRTPTSIPPTVTFTPTRTPTLAPGQPSNTPTRTPTRTPTLFPSVPTNTPTRTPTNVPPTATRTPTPIVTTMPTTIFLNTTAFRLQGRDYAGASKNMPVFVSIKNTLNQWNANMVNLVITNLPLTNTTVGAKTIVLKPDGYLAREINQTLVTGQNTISLADIVFCAGDIDDNGTVNSFDYSELLRSYGQTTGRSDLDGSGQVNSLDFSLLLSNFFETPATQTCGL